MFIHGHAHIHAQSRDPPGRGWTPQSHPQVGVELLEKWNSRGVESQKGETLKGMELPEKWNPSGSGWKNSQQSGIPLLLILFKILESNHHQFLEGELSLGHPFVNIICFLGFQIMVA